MRVTDFHLSSPPSRLNDTSSDEYQPDLESSHDESAEHNDVEDDYTPLDPTYLPPGLEEHDQGASEKDLGDEEEAEVW